MRQSVGFFQRTSTVILGGLITVAIFLVKDQYAERAKDLATAIRSNQDKYTRDQQYFRLMKVEQENRVQLEGVLRHLQGEEPADNRFQWNIMVFNMTLTYQEAYNVLDGIHPLVELLPKNSEKHDKLNTLATEVMEEGAKIDIPLPLTGNSYERTQGELRKAEGEFNALLAKSETFAKEALEEATKLKEREEFISKVCLIVVAVLTLVGSVLAIGNSVSEARKKADENPKLPPEAVLE
jgi:hypothetical protein